MTESPPTPGFSVLVEEEELVAGTAPDQGPLQPGEERQHFNVPFVRKRVIKRQNLDLEKMQQQLDGVQGQVDDLLGRLQTQTSHGFSLHEVQVSVGISAQGSIAVVTAGIQASLTLIYGKG